MTMLPLTAIHRVKKKVIYLFFSIFLTVFLQLYETFKQWHKRLAACVSVRGGHLEHML